MSFASSEVFMRNFGNSGLDRDSLIDIYGGFLITFASQIGYGVIQLKHAYQTAHYRLSSFSWRRGNSIPILDLHTRNGS